MAELEPTLNKEVAFDTLSSQFQKDNFKAVTNVIGKTFNRVQAPNFQIRDGFWTDDAVDNELTILGKFWNELRNGQTDAELRPAIIEATTKTRSGTFPEIKNDLLGKFEGTIARLYGLWSSGEEAAYVAVTDANITITELEDISAAGVGVLRGAFLQQEDTAGKLIKGEGGQVIIGIGG